MSYSIWICIAALAVLGFICLSAAFSRGSITEDGYRRFRAVVILFSIVFAAIALLRITEKVAIPGSIPGEFVSELVGYLMFWVLVPPAWFFTEYFSYDNGWVTGVPGGLSKRLAQIKSYADYASKIWAAVVAMLLILISLKH